MKPYLDAFCVVTASRNADLYDRCAASWRDKAVYQWPIVLEPGFGVVPLYAKGVERALNLGATFIACLHDDVLIDHPAWDAEIIEFFSAHPKCGLAGFGGATGLGHDLMYKIPYDPMQLARQNFLSNMREADVHGTRTTRQQRVACLDGFSLIGRRAFWQGWFQDGHGRHSSRTVPDQDEGWNLFTLMSSWGIVHHAYDAALGCFAKRLGWEVWLTPIACDHLGGRTAVADRSYHQWAGEQHPLGDQGFWLGAHQIVYDQFRDVLPIRV